MVSVLLDTGGGLAPGPFTWSPDMRRLVALLTVTLALSACGNLTGPQTPDEAAQAAKAKKLLETNADTNTGLSGRISSN